MPEFKVGNKTVNIPDTEKEQIAAFLKRFPNAVKVDSKSPRQKMIDKQVAAKAAADAAAQPAAGNAGVVKRMTNLTDTPEDETERQKYITSNPNKVVDQATYDRLMGLYEVAKKADPTGRIKTKEAEEFQRAYHDVLPGEASKIIAKHPVKTRKAKEKNLKWWDLEGNVDQYFGPRTKQYMEALTSLKPGEKPIVPPVPITEEDKVITKKDDVVVKDEERKPFETNTPTNYNIPSNGPWWLQDIIQTAGAAGDLARIKKYLPYQATPEVRLPDATFYDPTRELAANAEQANMAYQAQTAFTNPQQLAAASAVTQGQAAKNAADVMGRYNNLNVGLANQLSQERTGIMNTASQNKANLDTQLWDKYTIANQQFDNSKAKARQNLRSSYIDAITNRANTANLNSLYPQYAVDPSTGGFTYFQGDPTKIKAANKYDFDNDYAKALKITGNAENALAYLKLKNTGKLASDETADRTFPNTYPGTSSPQ
jgi:hypothetical protein